MPTGLLGTRKQRRSFVDRLAVAVAKLGCALRLRDRAKRLLVYEGVGLLWVMQMLWRCHPSLKETGDAEREARESVRHRSEPIKTGTFTGRGKNGHLIVGLT